MHVLEARRAFDKALERDSASVEANLYRVYMLLSRGGKRERPPRHRAPAATGRERLERASRRGPSRCAIDGLYEEALDQFNISLRLNPSNAAMIYNHRARVYQYQNQLELAGDEIEKGLTLEPRQPLLRISQGYQQMRIGQLSKAVETLEKVTQDDNSLRIVYPTIAMCYVQLGERKRATEFIREETLAAAEADSEMGLPPRHLLRRRRRQRRSPPLAPPRHLSRQRELPLVHEEPRMARPWPTTPTLQRTLEDLKKSFKRNQKNWKRLLAQVVS